MIKNKNVSSGQNAHKVDTKLIEEDYKKLEDKTSKKIKVGI